MVRGVLGGLAGFALAGIVLAAVLGRVLPDDWATGAFVAAGFAAAVTAGAAGGVAGTWLGPPPAAVLGALLGALVLVALQPQLDLVTLAGVLAVGLGAVAAALPASRRTRHTSIGGRRTRVRA
jgi:hypothetical protein